MATPVPFPSSVGACLLTLAALALQTLLPAQRKSEGQGTALAQEEHHGNYGGVVGNVGQRCDCKVRLQLRPGQR